MSGIAIDNSRFTFVTDEEDAARLQVWYENAIGRTSDYVGDLEGHLLSGSGILWRPWGMESGLVGFFVGDNIFVVSHLAPKSLREARELMIEAAATEVPMVLAVPEYQARQLEKVGFHFVTKIPQYFAGDIVMKNLMVNDAVTEDDIAELFEHYTRETENEELHQDNPPREFPLVVVPRW